MTAQANVHEAQPRSHPAAFRNTSSTTPTRAPVPDVFLIRNLRVSGVGAPPKRSKWMSLVFAIGVVSCVPPNSQTNSTEDLISNLTEERDSLKQELAAQKALFNLSEAARAIGSSSPAKASKKPEKPSEKSAGDDERCLQDYCPCEESGTVDRMLCRNLRAGLPVDDGLMASGAAQRDARAAMRRWNTDNPEQAVPVEQ